MTGRKVFWIILLAFFPVALLAQQPVMDYSRADSVALATKSDGDINQLTQKLTEPFSNPFLKTRAIFRWITNNIVYDYKYYNRTSYKGNEPKGFECSGDSLDCDTREKVWETQYAIRVLGRGKGVCQGYALLFKKMCAIAGIEAEVVPGYVRTEDYEVGNMGELVHAWNAVLLDGVYYVLDATWAAGGCSKDEDGKLKAFIKDYNDYYWLTPPEEFAKNHFPEDGKRGLPVKYTRENFLSNPYYCPVIISYMKLLAPASGIIKAKKGDTIRFKLKYMGPLRLLQINTNIFQNPDVLSWARMENKKLVMEADTPALKKQQYVPYKRDGYIYEFAYVVKDYSLDHIDLIFDKLEVMRFKVQVH